MEIFHEGLPGSGKSYEAMARHIIPALQNGREVFAYIEGINHAKVAEAAELPLERVEMLLHQITREQVKEVYKHVRDNSLVVLDEAQNFWPTQRQPLPEAITQFITEHRHRGLDILLMGQDMRDVHATWRRRVSQKVVFNKLDALGAEKRYSYVVFKATAPEKFAKVTQGVTSYDTRYFGTYASHVSEDTNTGNYKDDRANVRNAWWVRWGMPLAIGAAAWGGYTAWQFFHPGAKPVPQAGHLQPGVLPAPVAASAAPLPLAPVPPVKKRSFVEDLNAKYRPRLAMLYQQGNRQFVIIEWWDGDHVRERLTGVELEILGATVEVRGTVAKLGDTWVTQWPVERAAQPAMVGAQVVPVSSMGLPALN